MCLIVFNWSPEQTHWLTLAANRDEFWHRPTAELHSWNNDSGIVAGQDLEQGGTWLGGNHYGQFAALTNVRAPGVGPANPQSRGLIVRDYLVLRTTAEQYGKDLLQRCEAFAPFNLLLADRHQLLFLSNYPQPVMQPVTPGMHVLSNASLDTPWPKALLAKQQLSQWQPTTEDVSALADLLSDPSVFADEQLPETGVPYEWEKMLSAQLIVSDAYGTRCSTAIIATDAGMTLCEHTRNQKGRITDTRQQDLTFR